jgi:hypothetical protein
MITKLKQIKKNRKSQSETVGFIIIILLVVIVGVIFLGLSLRNKPSIVTVDAELSNFLLASSKFTTDCAQDYEPYYLSLEQVASNCYNQDSPCLNGKTACEVLNKTYGDMLKSFRPGGKTLDYYKLAFYYSSNRSMSLESANKFISDITSGNSSTCSSKRGGRNEISLSPGMIVEQLEVCLAS